MSEPTVKSGLVAGVVINREDEIHGEFVSSPEPVQEDEPAVQSSVVIKDIVGVTAKAIESAVNGYPLSPHIDKQAIPDIVCTFAGILGGAAQNIEGVKNLYVSLEMARMIVEKICCIDCRPELDAIAKRILTCVAFVSNKEGQFQVISAAQCAQLVEKSKRGEAATIADLIDIGILDEGSEASEASEASDASETIKT